MERFFYKLTPPRPTFDRDMTEVEMGIMQKHFAYWGDLTERSIAVVYGPVADPRGAFGFAVVDVVDQAAAHALGNSDPAIQANAGFTYEVHSMPTGA